MREEESKWCCGPLQVMSAIMVASLLAEGATQEDLDRTFPKRGKCIGADCMAWRTYAGGYCGLAGKP